MPDTLELTPDDQAVTQALQWLERIAEREGWPAKTAFGLTLSLDEALTNIVSYAFDPPPGKPSIVLDYRRDGPRLLLELRDNGRPYDPTSVESAPLAQSLDEFDLGGHGVRLMRHYLQDLAYRRDDGWNCLTMTMEATQ
jgi:anti-sigma regulatory factor (Ser/Thr protein kinase)